MMTTEISRPEGFEQGALDGGRVNSVGIHEELLASGPLYRELAENQLANITAGRAPGTSEEREATKSYTR
jgi:hypothetical protein